MTPRDFCYWLQGYFELRKEEHLHEEQLITIKEHLQLVFVKETDGLGLKPAPEINELFPIMFDPCGTRINDVTAGHEVDLITHTEIPRSC